LDPGDDASIASIPPSMHVKHATRLFGIMAFAHPDRQLLCSLRDPAPAERNVTTPLASPGWAAVAIDASMDDWQVLSIMTIVASVSLQDKTAYGPRRKQNSYVDRLHTMP